MVEGICVAIDVAGRKIVVEPPEGLLDLNVTKRQKILEMRFDIVTIFPRMIEAALAEGILARAIQRNVLTVRARDLREFTEDRHRTVDDVPYGGGPGMVLKPEPLFKAVDAIRAGRGRAAGDRAGVAARQALHAD